MQIKKIKARNYRSFETLEVYLDKFNVIVGANASGKSNFISILKFLNNLAEYGVNDAISLIGGIEYLRNVYMPDNDLISIEIEVELAEKGIFSFRPLKEEKLAIKPNNFIYKIEIKITNDKKEFIIDKEEIRLDCDFVKPFFENGDIEPEFINKGEIVIVRDGDYIKSSIIPEIMEDDDLFKKFFIFDDDEPFDISIDRKESLLGSRKLPIPILFLIIERVLRGINLYEINPKPPKEFSRISGKSELEPDGKNLILVLKKLLNDKEKEEKLSELLKDFLPFIEKITVNKLIDKYICANIKEIFSNEKYLPASLMSDGTINIIALIIILYFEEKPIIVIEEPEGNIHPYLISKVVDMMKDVSQRMDKQIIITTHNPEIVKHSGIDHLYFMQRSESGFSRMMKPIENKQVKVFLENQLGLDELFVQNFLE